MKHGGILRIGFKLLVNDKPKFSALLIGITFAVFLMMQMTAMFAGMEASGRARRAAPRWSAASRRSATSAAPPAPSATARARRAARAAAPCWAEPAYSPASTATWGTTRSSHLGIHQLARPR